MVMTKKRKEILEIIEKSNKPLTAEEIYKVNKLKPNFSTIYRTLNFLESKNLIKSVSFENGPKYFYSTNKHYHFLYCIKCGNIEIFDKCTATQLEEFVEEKFDFQIIDHVFYFKGLCKNCQEG
ncbi:Fur family transcriptional regulator [Thermosipho atlanticus]|uniref:Fur family transcriptional regulator, ferric uptake regulator n=1 Tax=Thermosipho atlanticus DSM 15807 TaxID=1123380 RepID=A0A1M5SZN6_9BACT|nr:transcriptional repressor [Thermosipho atlanticus]SHH43936.1 Fur family transcriptional regulator, ferric uptake regulator [Thermosipho atlanticus DSM 15807]